ncbi:unnamed protein product [Ceutorhynchus assimilis]|uniref:MADF domain-containing protein n=1 Tax=Ceutorhynchus assimilis TaxID=467358 RepID=A0A9N9QMU3_9CUCU|nr:unnamed protein product [Ceutorhynchus assimilis]
MSGNNRSVYEGWTMYQDKTLINFVSQHEALYNIKCKDFRKTHMKLILWRKLAKLIKGKTDVECAKRWAYVRGYYVRRIGKETTNEAARRRAEQLSSFLTSSTGKKRVPESSEESSNEDVDLEEEKEEVKLPAKKLKSIGMDQEKSPENSETLKNGNISLEESLESINKIHKGNHSEEQDETDLFFASMAKSVKKLPEKERVYVRLEIGSIVGNAELRHLEHQNYNDCSRLTFPASNSSSNLTSNYNKEVSDIL